MDDFETSHRLIEDPEVAYVVAHSAKGERSLAAAMRLVDSTAREAIANNATPYATLQKLIGAYAVYPEVFERFYKPSNPNAGPTDLEIMKAATETIRLGALPTHKIVGDFQNSSADRFDGDADVIESATEALLVNPPSQDFLNDFELGDIVYLGTITKGYERRVTAKDIVRLHESVQGYRQRYIHIVCDYDRMTKYYEQEPSNKTKLRVIQAMLERVDTYMQSDDSDKVKMFNAEVRDAENSEETTIGHLRELCDNGAAIALEQIEALIDDALAKYNAIISGEASRYTTTRTDSAEK